MLFLKELGAVLYKDNFFISDYDALAKAIQDQDPNPARSVWFNDDVFGALDWKSEPDESLDTLYRWRAQRLREKYSKLILSYSGGADSHQVLKIFEKENIHLDEIHCNFPLKLLERTTAVNSPTHPLGLIFEYELSAKPALLAFSKKYPKTKIKINDYTDYLDKNYNLKFFQENERYLLRSPGMFQDLKRVYQKEMYQAASEHNPGTGVIFGADKPCLRLVKGELVFMFTDIGRTMSSILQKGDINNFTPEMFYWSRDLPQIPIKQSHVVMNSLRRDPTLYATFLNDPHMFFKFRDTELHKLMIYPDWNVGTYQKAFKNVDDGIVDYFFKDRNVASILHEKNKFYYDQFKPLHNIVNDIRIYNTTTHNKLLTGIMSRPYSLGYF